MLQLNIKHLFFSSVYWVKLKYASTYNVVFVSEIKRKMIIIFFYKFTKNVREDIPPSSI